MAQQRHFKRLALIGVSDLAEIAAICALESDITLVGLVDPASKLDRFVGLPVVKDIESIDGKIDGVVITALMPSPAIDALAQRARDTLGEDAVLVPQLLMRKTEAVSS